MHIARVWEHSNHLYLLVEVGISFVFWDSDDSCAIFQPSLFPRHWHSTYDIGEKATIANPATFGGEGVGFQVLGDD